MSFRTPLERRRRHAERRKAKYWHDPEYRLRCINAARRRLGLPPHEHILDAATRGPND